MLPSAAYCRIRDLTGLPQLVKVALYDCPVTTTGWEAVRGSTDGMRSTLVGRDRELEEIDRMLDAVRAGESRSLIIQGAAGVGKSALLAYAAERAGSSTILRSGAVETEADLPFAGLHGLLWPLADHLDELPERQADALAGALGLRESSGVDRLLVSAATLSMLALAAEAGPVVCLVDDLQWLDAASAEALLFSARRLRAEPIALLFTHRHDEDGRSRSLSGIDRWQIGGLSRPAATQLLSAVAPLAAPAAVDWLLAQADGNPLALTELPAALSREQLEGRAALPEVVSLTERLSTAFTRRIEDLPTQSRMALLMVALDDLADPGGMLLALRHAGLDDHALEAAERAGIVSTARGRIVFRHPLIRAALLATSTLAERRRAHEALASAPTSEGDGDRRLWHQALAAMGPDAELADALDEAARRAASRGAHAAASSTFVRAAELSDTDAARRDRITAAAEAAWTAGEPERARTLIARALPSASEVARGALLHLRGVIEGRTGDVRHAAEILAEAAQATDDPSLALEALSEGSDFAVYAGDVEQAIELGTRAQTIPARSTLDGFRRAALGGLAAALSGAHEKAPRLLAEAIGLAEHLDDPLALTFAARLAALTSTHGDGLPQATRAVAVARERGLLSLLPIALREQSTALIGRGQFRTAYRAAEEGLSLSDDFGQRRGASWTLANLASLDALRGDEMRARQRADEALEIANATGAVLVACFAERALGLLDLTLGRPDQATERLLMLTTHGNRRYHPITAMWAIPDLVEAAAKAGRVDEVAPQLQRYVTWAQPSATPPRVSLLARCRALAGVGDTRVEFELAIANAGTLSTFQQARTDLLFGEWLRRERQPREARIHLRRAEAMFREVGTTPWEQRALLELRATGETVKRRDPATLDELTPQEARIAGLVSSGLTNRQIAAQLHLSPRTVEYHLRKVFTKLAVSSRVELVQMGVPQNN